MPGSIAVINRGEPVSGSVKNYQLKWLNETALKSDLKLGNHQPIAIESLKGAHKDVIVISPKRGPPVGLKKIEINCNGVKINGKVNPGNSVLYFDYGSLPKGLRNKPGDLQKLLSGSDIKVIGKMAKGPGKTVKYELTNSRQIESLIKNKNYEKAAPEIVKAPQKLKESIYKNLKNELYRNKEFIDKGHYSKANHHLDYLGEIHGVIPELQIQKGINYFRQGRYKAGKNNIHKALRDIDGNELNQFCKEINLQLENSPFEFVIKENTATWKYGLDKKINGKIVNEKEAAKILESNAPIYIHDSKGLHNSDWTVGGRASSLHQAIRGRRVVKLFNKNIKNLKPEFLYASNNSLSKLPIKMTSTKNYPFKGGGPYPHGFRLCNPLFGDDDDDDERKEKSGYIYLVVDSNQGIKSGGSHQ